MAINFDDHMKNADAILLSQGLYNPVTFTEITGESSYDPVTGSYGTSSSTNHSFNAVLLSESSSPKDGSGFKVTLDIIVIARNISFTPIVDQIFSINGIPWQVASSKMESQNTVYEISLGRK